METAFVTKADIHAVAHIATRSIGAEIGAPGSLPIRRATVTSEVLARLLAGARMVGLDAVSSVSTTRLAAVIGYLQRRYAWRIDRFDKAAGCEDGRVARVAVYSLPPEVIAAAMAAGAATWCAEVRAARRLLRANAAWAKRAAERVNAARRHRPHPGQWGLFESEGSEV